MSPSLHLTPTRITKKKKKKSGKGNVAVKMLMGLAVTVALGGIFASQHALASQHMQHAESSNHLAHHLKQSKSKRTMVGRKILVAKQERTLDGKDGRPQDHRRLNSSTTTKKSLAQVQHQLRQKKEMTLHDKNRQQSVANVVNQLNRINTMDQSKENKLSAARQRQAILKRRRTEREIVVKKPIVPYNISNDPLQNPNFDSDHNMTVGISHQINMTPAVPYLGVLIDGGRHFFPIDWLKRTVNRLADMNYNLIHLRLTDDQAFNILLDSHPELAYPSHVNNDDRSVWTASELREFAKYCRARGVSIMPEINVPGHGGAWSGAPGMVVQCPEFTCERGYGLPINVTHPGFRPLLTDVLKEIVDIFDPPFLHLGGDEVDMAGPCFDEIGLPMFDYAAFERELKEIVEDVGYPEDQIVRWEITGHVLAGLKRAGAIEQFWFSHPGRLHKSTGRWFVSTWLYFDTNKDQNAYEVWTKTRHSFYHVQQKTVPTAIIAGTFELSTTWWYDRNILGRLLAVAMGASNQTITELDPKKVEESILQQYDTLCNELGWGDSICLTHGRPVIPTHEYTAKWKAGWGDWKSSICERMTKQIKTRVLNDPFTYDVERMSNEFFWKVFGHVIAFNSRVQDVPALPDASESLQSHSVTYAGVVLDLTTSLVPATRLAELLNVYVTNLGLNLIQLPLVGDHGFVANLPTLDDAMHHSWVPHLDKSFLSRETLKKFVDSAREKGVQVMPQISVSTRAAGWYSSGYVTKCPVHMCKHGTMTAAVSDPVYPATVYTLIHGLREIFSSDLFHLGYDYREEAKPCFEEAKKDFSDLEIFEGKLHKLLELGGIPSEKVLRYVDPAEDLYEVRAGELNHYPTSFGADQLGDNEAAFVNVDVMEDPWEMYQYVRKLVAKQPLGIMAELKELRIAVWDRVNIAGRLLVYAMAVSNMPEVSSRDDLTTQYNKVCETLVETTSLKIGHDCQFPEPLDHPLVYEPETAEHHHKVCSKISHVEVHAKSIHVPPFYSEQQMKESIAAPSPFTESELEPVARPYPSQRTHFVTTADVDGTAKAAAEAAAALAAKKQQEAENGDTKRKPNSSGDKDSVDEPQREGGSEPRAKAPSDHGNDKSNSSAVRGKPQSKAN